MQVALTLAQQRTEGSSSGLRPRAFSLASRWQCDLGDKAPLKVLWRAEAGDTRGAAPPPFRFGRAGGRAWEVTMASVPPGDGGSRCGRGCASRRAGGLSLGGRGAQTMGPGRALSRRAGLPRARRAAAALPRAPGRPPRPPAVPRPPPAAAAARRFLPATPRPPGAARRAEKLGGVAAAATRAAGPGKQRGDVCGRKSGNGAPVGAAGGRSGGSRSPLFAARTSTRAEQEINTSCRRLSPHRQPNDPRGPVSHWEGFECVGQAREF